MEILVCVAACNLHLPVVQGDVVVWAPSAVFGSMAVLASLISLALPETKHSVMPEVRILAGNNHISYSTTTVVLDKEDLTDVSSDPGESDNDWTTRPLDFQNSVSIRL